MEDTPEFNEQMDYAAVSLELLRHMQYFKELEKKFYAALEDVEFHLSVSIENLQKEVNLQSEVLVEHLYPKQDDVPCSCCGAERDISGYFYNEESDIDDVMERVETGELIPGSAEDWRTLSEYAFEPVFLEDEPQEELPPDFFSEQEEKPVDTTLKIDNVTVPITFPNMKMALEWTNSPLDNLEW